MILKFRESELLPFVSKSLAVVHGVSKSAWASRFNLEPYTAPCPKCGEPLHTSIPFAYKQLRGLRSPQCSCGHKGFYCFKHRFDHLIHKEK